MPPPINHPCLNLELLAGTYFVKQFPAHEGIPTETLQRLSVVRATSTGPGLFSVTRTADEISVVGDAPGDDGEWKCIKIAGPMDFGLTGVVCSFTIPLRDAKVPVFAISTWNTDYVLVPKEHAQTAVTTLAKDGWHFVGPEGSA
ncbi:hypothetical protein BV22DRAFT_1195339 [Leucogyrophana mollusca]|uniref:Uncharacterized protein n=1 Tax=Leucogyrophana mollusca TaxID=85980 RepID=A0ACB8BH35_9AGAM|nr:hypothetical protein BV22DRAFT_1195339 [Leucogyrophana mollusca]